MSGLIYENDWSDMRDEEKEFAEAHRHKNHYKNLKKWIFECRDTDEVFDKTTDGYRKYLRSEQWKKVKTRLRKFYKSQRYRWECACCYTTEVLQVHHKTYDRIGGYELLRDDLMVLCGECHIDYHRYLTERKSDYRPIEEYRQYRSDNYDIKPARVILRKKNERKDTPG